MSFELDHETLADPKALIHVRVGMVSPLWPLFAGAAVTGAAWWWMTRWAQPDNLEAMFAASAKALEAAPEPIALAEPTVEAAEAVVETATESVVETVEAAAEPAFEVTPEPVLEAIAEAIPDLEPVGGEAAPISPVLEALAPDLAAKPKARKKPADGAPDDLTAAD
jgi:hypothetical protein